MRPVLHAVCASAVGTQLQTSPEEENWQPHFRPQTPHPHSSLTWCHLLGVIPQVMSTGDCSSTQLSTSTASEGTSMRGNTGSQGPAPQRGSCHPQEGVRVIESAPH